MLISKLLSGSMWHATRMHLSKNNVGYVIKTQTRRQKAPKSLTYFSLCTPWSSTFYALLKLMFCQFMTSLIATARDSAFTSLHSMSHFN